MHGSAAAGCELPSPGSNHKSVKAFSTRTTPGNAKSKEKLDRFIPNRAGLDMDVANLLLLKENGSGAQSGREGGASTTEAEELVPGDSTAAGEYQAMLAAGMNVDRQGRILAFRHKAPAPPEGHESGLRGLYTQNAGPAPNKKQFRHVPQTQEKILDAPELMDDYYLNLLDWSRNNVIAVALGRCVYLWNAAVGTVEQLCEMPNEGDYVSSVAWGQDGGFLAVGTSDGKVQIWDAVAGRQLRELVGHTQRVSCVAWNGTTLSSGGKDALICNWDVRKRRDDANLGTLTAHEQEVCGLKWSLCGQQLASGGNDNALCIWDSQLRLQHQLSAHQAAVKALAWCPFQSNLLATGGGTADRCIKFWNTHTGAMLSSVDTGSQVCALQWNRHERELLSSHGFAKNQLCLWKYPSLVQVAELTGHTGRVLHLATSPDGASVVSASADETLRFWRCFGDPPSATVVGGGGGAEKAAGAAGAGFSGLRSIR